MLSLRKSHTQQSQFFNLVFKKKNYIQFSCIDERKKFNKALKYYKLCFIKMANTLY